MPLLQVRDFPEPLYRALEQRAKDERRSLSQQTIVLLDDALAAPQDNRERRKALLEHIHAMHVQEGLDTSTLSSPVDLIREDRDR